MTYNMMLIHGMAMHGIKIIKQIKKNVGSIMKRGIGGVFVCGNSVVPWFVL